MMAATEAEEPVVPPPESAAVVALSDLHLGAPGSYFLIPGLQERLWDAIQTELGTARVKVLVLVGDILDLAATTGRSAYRAAADFFARISRAPLQFDRILYVLGNHDHHLWSVIEEDRMFRGFPAVLGGDTEANRYGKRTAAPGPVCFCYAGDAPFSRIFPAALYKRLVMTYPFHPVYEELEPAPIQWLFHHGHYFDPRIAPLRRGLARRGDLRGFEVANAPYLEALFYYLAWDPEQLAKGLYYLDVIARCAEFAKKLTGLSPRTERGTLRRLGALLWRPFGDRGARAQASGRGDMAGGHLISDILDTLGETRWWHRGTQVTHVFVFGHSHRPGSFLSPSFQGEASAFECYDLGGWVLETSPKKWLARRSWAEPAFFCGSRERRRLVPFPLSPKEKAHLLRLCLR